MREYWYNTIWVLSNVSALSVVNCFFAILQFTLFRATWFRPRELLSKAIRLVWQSMGTRCPGGSSSSSSTAHSREHVHISNDIILCHLGTCSVIQEHFIHGRNGHIYYVKPMGGLFPRAACSKVCRSARLCCCARPKSHVTPVKFKIAFLSCLVEVKTAEVNKHHGS